MSYTIKNLSRKQLQLIQLALETQFRLEMAQVDVALDQIRGKNGETNVFDWETVQQINRIVKDTICIDHNASWGVGFHEETDTEVDMMQVIRHKLAWERAVEDGIIESEQSPRKFSEMMGVCYDKPMKWSKESLIEVVNENTVTDDEAK